MGFSLHGIGQKLKDLLGEAEEATTHAVTEFAQGIGDTAVDLFHFPDDVAKYITGTDQRLGERRSWSQFGTSFSTNLPTLLRDNLVTRTADVAMGMFYGGIDLVLGHLPNYVLNEKLHLNVPYLSPAPRTAREWGQQLSMGVLVAATPALKVRGMRALGMEAGPEPMNVTLERDLGGPPRLRDVAGDLREEPAWGLWNFRARDLMDRFWRSLEEEVRARADGGDESARQVLSFIGDRQLAFHDLMLLIERGNAMARDLFVQWGSSELAGEIVSAARQVIETGEGGESGVFVARSYLNHLALAGSEKALVMLRDVALAGSADDLFGSSRTVLEVEAQRVVIARGSVRLAEPDLIRMAEEGHAGAVRVLLDTGLDLNPGLRTVLGALNIERLLEAVQQDPSARGAVNGLARIGNSRALAAVREWAAGGDQQSQFFLQVLERDQAWDDSTRSWHAAHRQGQLLPQVSDSLRWLLDFIRSSDEPAVAREGPVTLDLVKEEGRPAEFVWRAAAVRLDDGTAGLRRAFGGLEPAEKELVGHAIQLALDSLGSRQAMEHLLARLGEGDPLAREALSYIRSHVGEHAFNDLSHYNLKVIIGHDLDALDTLIFLESFLDRPSLTREFGGFRDLGWTVEGVDSRSVQYERALTLLARLALLENQEARRLLEQLASNGDEQAKWMLDLVDQLAVYVRSGRDPRSLFVIAEQARGGDEGALAALVNVALTGDRAASGLLKNFNVRVLAEEARRNPASFGKLIVVAEWGSVDAVFALHEIAFDVLGHNEGAHGALVSLDPRRIYDDLKELGPQAGTQHLRALETLRDAGNERAADFLRSYGQPVN